MTPIQTDDRSTERGPERALLVGLATRAVRRQRVDENLDELQQLAESAGAVVIRRVVQERTGFDPATFIGSGKVKEVADTCEAEHIDLVVFDDDLSRVQVRNLERNDQVQNRGPERHHPGHFCVPRQNQRGEDAGGSRPTGVYAPASHPTVDASFTPGRGHRDEEVPARPRLKRTEESSAHASVLFARDLPRSAKSARSSDRVVNGFRRVALVGYTNVGKSTLLNWFTDAGVLVEDRLFATLDSTVRLVELSRAQRVLLSDTVGFIRKLPHQLVASFKSTLEEATEADLLLHVVDISHPLFEEQIAVVNETLEEIGAAGKPVITVFNKIDRLQDRALITRLTADHPNAVFISAWRGINMAGLRDRIIVMLQDTTAEYEVLLTQEQYKILSHIHDVAEILEKKFTGKRIHVKFRAPKAEGDRIVRSVKASGTRRMKER